MPLCNRVDPFGAFHATQARGLFTGNRGIIHDPETRTLLRRRWTTKAWIICDLHWNGRRRDVWGRNGPAGGAGWTELFFLDEVTALAAGHRPCFYCRRKQAETFRDALCEGTRLDRASAPEMDRILHAQRVGADKPAVSSREAEDLPDGAMIAVQGQAFAMRSGRALPWSFAGYSEAQPPPDHASLLTPPATVAALRQGYAPRWHPSVRGGSVTPRS